MDNKDQHYKNLEKYAKDQQGQFRTLQTRRGRKFPVNLVILLTVLGFLVYFWMDGSFFYNPNDPNNKAMPSIITKLVELAARNQLLHRVMTHPRASAAAPSANSADAGARSVASKNPDDPTYIPTDEDIRVGRFVQIAGQYFKYNPTHIYYVNGVKTFYESNRKPLAVEPKAAPGTGD